MTRNDANLASVPFFRRMRVRATVAFVAVAVTATLVITLKATPAELLRRAEILRAKDPSAAKRLLTLAIHKSNGTYPDARVLLLQLIGHSGDWNQARQQFTTVDTEDCQSRFLLSFARAASEAQQHELAENVATAVYDRSQKPQHRNERFTAVMVLYRVAFDRQDEPKLLRYIAELTQANPRAPNWWWQLAAIHESRGNQAAAAAVYQQAMRNVLPQPDANEMQHKLIEHLIFIGDAKTARDELANIEWDQHQMVRVQVHRARLFRLEGKPQQALDALNSALPQLGDRPQALRLRGLLHFDLGDFDRAIADFELVAKADSADEIVRFKLAECFRQLGKSEQAQEHREAYQRIHRRRSTSRQFTPRESKCP